MNDIIERDMSELLDIHLFELSGTQVTVATAIVVALIVALTALVSGLTQRAVRHALHTREVDEGTIEATNRLLHYGVMFLGLGVALETIGVQLSALFAAGALFAVGLGFALQTMLQNFASGIILLAERAITPGDILEVEGRVIKVVRMGIRATVARTRDGEDIVIPNSVLAQTSIKNFTLDDAAYRVRASVGVTYGSDLKVVFETLQRVAAELEGAAPNYMPQVFLTEFGDSSVNFEVAVWTADPWFGPGFRSKLHSAIWWAFKEQGITIAFPQLDVHFDKDAFPAPARTGS